MDPRILGIIFFVTLLIVNVMLAIRHGRVVAHMKWRHMMSLHAVSQACKHNLTPTAYELIDAVIDEEMDKV